VRHPSLTAETAGPETSALRRLFSQSRYQNWHARSCLIKPASDEASRPGASEPFLFIFFLSFHRLKIKVSRP